jgi:hypothetical protein
VNLTEQQPKHLDRNSLESHSKDGMLDLIFAQERPVRTLAPEDAKEWNVSPESLVLDLFGLC